MLVNGVNFEIPNSIIATKNVIFEAPQSVGGIYDHVGLSFDKNTLNPGESAFAYGDFVIRASSFSNPTILELVGLTCTGTAYKFFEVYGLDSDGERVIQGVHDTDILDSTIEFASLSDLNVFGFEIYLPPEPPSYLLNSRWYSDEGMGSLQIPLDSGTLAMGITSPNSVYSGHTDEDRFSLVHHDLNIHGPPRHELHFDLGFIPPTVDPGNVVRFGLRAFCDQNNSSWAFIYSSDNVTWNRPDGTRHDFQLGNTWYTTTWDVGGFAPNTRYFGLRGYDAPKTLHIGYLYLDNVLPGVIGSLSWTGARLWNLRFSRLFVNGVSYE